MVDTLWQNLFSGSLPAGDGFQFGWWSLTPAAAAPGDMLNWAADWLVDFMTDSSDAPTHLFPPGMTFSGVTVNQRDIGTGALIAQAQTAVSRSGDSGQNSLPQECAVCVSIKTIQAGRRGAGRFYLPCLAVNETTSTGLILTSAVTTLMSGLVTAFTNYEGRSDSPVLGVYSRADHAFSSRTSFGIGNVYDVQRRRRDGLVEARNVHVF